MSLYRQPDEFLKPQDEKAILFFTWPQVLLILSGIVAGSILGNFLQLSPTGSLLATVICTVVGLGLGTLRVERVPLYQVLGALVRYWVARIRDRQAAIVRSEDLWEVDRGTRRQGMLSVEGAEGPLFQVGDSDRRGRGGGILSS